MINIPTELLRTLVAVVDMRSFTKAAQLLGVTQPAVSAQIKRLQLLLDCELFDKSAPGVSLTASGDLVVNYARRMLSINDQIIGLSVPRLVSRSLRIGVPGDFVALYLPRILADFRQQYPDFRVSVRSDNFDSMARDLRQGDLNLMVGLSESGITLDARHQWVEPSVWLRAQDFELDPNAPVPLVTFGENWPIHRAALAALNRADRAFEVVFIGLSKASVVEAVRQGLGVAPMTLSRAVNELDIWDDGPLPPLGDLYCGIYLSESGDRPQLERLADAIFEVIGPRTNGCGENLALASATTLSSC
jgi:DNA-binding transcriptional LysR family regulator